jgi:hypothetical protein
MTSRKPGQGREFLTIALLTGAPPWRHGQNNNSNLEKN